MHSEKKNKISFSNYVETYQKEVQSSIDFAGQDLDFYIRLKADLIIQLSGKYFNNPESIKILDIGSGMGLTDRHLTGHFMNLYGVDIEKELIKKASSYNPGVKYELYDGLNLPFGSSSFEMVFAINVLHHVLPDKWENFVKEMHRVLRDGGISIVFEHNPVNPLTRLAVSRCEFDRDAELIHNNRLKKIFHASGFKFTQRSFILFFPFRGRFYRGIEKILSWLPLGAQYFIEGKK